jgi:hypothetical protein
VPRLACVLLLGLAVAGCGGGGRDDAADVLAETEANLGEIRSGELSFALMAVGTGDGGGQVGVELTGPFAFRGEGELPVAEIAYTEYGGDETSEATFISTDGKAYLELDEVTYELPAQTVDDLRGAESSEGLARLGIQDWLLEPELMEAEGAVARVEGRLDVGEAATDLVAVLAELGAADAGVLDEASAETLERATRSSRVVVETGSDDRLLRRLTIEVELGVDESPELEQALESLGGRAELTFELRIERPNEPVDVAAPENAQPFGG